MHSLNDLFPSQILFDYLYDLFLNDGSSKTETGRIGLGCFAGFFVLFCFFVVVVFFVVVFCLFLFFFCFLVGW